ncbi:MAG TPA: DUF1800 domain-containing protein [Vicinamibacterales bacterium]|nr:DUF1800 domain-containing protein [Vicinamibacterales bacterium]
MDATLRALNRFGLGARRDERSRVSDPRGWLKAQLDGGAPSLRAPEGASPGEIGDALRALRMAGQGQEQDRREARQRLVELSNKEMHAALEQRVTAERPFVERLVAFWSNHLCVSSGGKAQVAPLAGSYERDVIRTHVLGRFEDMVMASARHPAMLMYLDNFQSIGPNSRGARDGRGGNGQRRGLNENYARELLELHTLGVNGGYTQQDVQELARILTGWTVSGIGGPGDRLQPPGRTQGRRQQVQALRGRPAQGAPIGFVFQELLHEPGTKTVLGERYREAGIEEGEKVIRTLCHHPSTARFVAMKLVTHFVSDEPPAAAVDRVAKAFSSSGGDLEAVARALVDEPEAWREDARKFRTPQDWFVAVLRAFDARDVKPNVPNLLRQLRQPLWSPASPQGFSDTLQDWADPDSLLNRGELARTLSGLAGTNRLDPKFLLDLVDVPATDPVHRLLADTTISTSDRLALAIAGPAFQWR